MITRRTIGFLGISLVASVANAAQWDLFPFGSIGAYYESNLGLNPVSGQELNVSGATGEAGVAIRSTAPKTMFSLRPYVRSTYFPNERDADYNNVFTDMTYNYTGLRSSAGLVAEFSQETVTSGVLPGTELRGDLGSPRDGDISVASTRGRRDLLSVYPSAEFALTQRGKLEVGASYVDVSFDRKLPGEELGYTFVSGTLGWAYSLSTLSTLSISTSAQKFDPLDAPGFAPSVGSTSNILTARWSRALTAKRRYYIQAGATRTTFERTTASSLAGKSDTGYNGGVGASWDFETSQLFADIVHSVQPSSTGAISNQTDARVQLVRALTPRWNATLGARAIYSQAIDPVAPTDSRQYEIASLGVEWRWTRRLAVVGNAEFIHQQLENQPGANTSRVSLSLAYDAGRSN